MPDGIPDNKEPAGKKRKGKKTLTPSTNKKTMPIINIGIPISQQVKRLLLDFLSIVLAAEVSAISSRINLLAQEMHIVPHSLVCSAQSLQIPAPQMSQVFIAVAFLCKLQFINNLLICSDCIITLIIVYVNTKKSVFYYKYIEYSVN